MHNRGSFIFTAFIVGCTALLLVGCDYCRSGRYKLTFQPPPRHASTTTVTGTDEGHIIELLQSALRERGFTQLRPDFWTRRGADVSWETNAPGALTLCVGAFGAKREVRESEQVELELVRFLLAQPGIAVTPVESSRRPAQK